MWMIWSTLVLPSLLVGVEAASVVAPAGDTSKIKVVRNPYYPLDVVDKLLEETMPKVEAWMDEKIAAGTNNKCTLENAAQRTEGRYMNYDRYAHDPIHSPRFNGNASSMGGNGSPDPTYKGVPQPGRTPNIIATGGGGGCVTEGPFSDMVVSLGPLAPTANDIPKNPRADGTASNPRCLRRDVNRNAAMGATADRAYKLLNGSTNINDFYNTWLGQPPPTNNPYPLGSHYIHAVDPGGDPNTSPGDPVFYFHHGALDRLWWIWQMQDPKNRLNAVVTLGMSGMYMPGMPGMSGHSRQRRQDIDSTMIDLEWLAPPTKLMDAADQLGGNGEAYCCVYV